MQDAVLTMIDTSPSRQEFTDLLERHRGIVFKVANSYAWQPDDRADLVQEIATQLWRAFPAYDPQRSFSTWMYRIALNVALSQVRRDSHRNRHSVALDQSLHEVADPSNVDPEMQQPLRQLQRVVQSLDPLNRALMLLYLEERSNREIGDILGLSETNVSSKISRLKQRIREQFS
jgi:RNA polymerase sigma-70 factor (ECF subfamily)